MTVVKCAMCGGNLRKNDDGTFTCLNCGTTQTTSPNSSPHNVEAVSNCAAQARNPNDVSKDQIYEEAMTTYKLAHTESNYVVAANLFNRILDYKDAADCMVECQRQAGECRRSETYIKACNLSQQSEIYYLSQAIDLFASISEWNDSRKKMEVCQQKIDALNRQISMNNEENEAKAILKRQKRKRIWIGVGAILVACIVICIAKPIIYNSSHSVEKVDVEIISKSSEYVPSESSWSRGTYYISLDYRILNNSPSTIAYLEVTTYVKDESGRLVDQFASSFGGSTGSTSLNLESHCSITLECRLEEQQPENNASFMELYNSSMSDLYITHKVTYVVYTD